MHDDLKRAIASVAAEPSRLPDADTAWARVQRERRIGGVVVGVLAVLAAVVVGVSPLVDVFSSDRVPAITAPPEQLTTGTPRTSATASTLRERSINGFGVSLLVPAGWELRDGDPTTWHGPEGSITVFASDTPYAAGGSGVEQHCRDEAEVRPGAMAQQPIERLIVAGETACLVTSQDGTWFVGVVRFPDAPNAPGRTTDLVVVGSGTDARAVIGSVQFTPDVNGGGGPEDSR